jgi:hypothetical protein
MCNFCTGSKPIFLNDENNHAFIKNNGVMTVAINCQEVSFKVDRCPMCGRLFKGVNYLNLRRGDDIWYADEDEGIVEHGTIHHVAIKNGKVDAFSVNFDCGDFDEFCGSGLGKHFFLHKVDAEDALAHPVDEFARIDEIPVHDKLYAGDEIWYVDVDENKCNIEHATVEHVGMENGSVEWFSVKFDNGDTEEFGPCALDQFCFKSYFAAQTAWDKKHLGIK